MPFSLPWLSCHFFCLAVLLIVGRFFPRIRLPPTRREDRRPVFVAICIHVDCIEWAANRDTQYYKSRLLTGAKATAIYQDLRYK
jgi:hypothetical protein